MTSQEFFDVWNNEVLTNYGYHQCVAVYNQYCIDVLGIQPVIVPNAVSIWNNYDTEEFDKIVNTPNNFPEEGDVVIWGTQIDQDGHVAVAQTGDMSGFTSFDQNFPLGSSCHFQSHNYTGVLGWLRPKPHEAMATITQKELDQLRHDRDQHYNDLQAALSQNAALSLQLNNLRGEFEDYVKAHPNGVSYTVPSIIQSSVSTNSNDAGNTIHPSILARIIDYFYSIFGRK